MNRQTGNVPLDFEQLVRDHSGRIRRIAWKVDWLSRFSILAFIAATAVMSIAPLRARRTTRSDDWTLRSRLEMEIEKLENQRRLMNRVG